MDVRGVVYNLCNNELLLSLAIIVAENKNEFYIGKLDINCGVIIRLNSEEDD